MKEMTITQHIKKLASYIMYFTGLVGAFTTAVGISQAIFSDKLISVVSLNGNACLKSNNELSAWEKILSESAGDFVYLETNLFEIPEDCDTQKIGLYPFMSDDEKSYSMPLVQPANANYLPSMHIPVAEASQALLADGFLDFFNEGSLVGRGVFFVDLQDNPHTGPAYHFVPAPYTLETSQMHKCTSSFNEASGWLARSLAFSSSCMNMF